MDSTATVTVLFCDVVGSTERLVRLGDSAGDHFRRALFTEFRTCVAKRRGQEVKNLGDGLMVVFERSTVDALACADEMHRAAAALVPDDPVRLRIGLSVGEVAEEDGDWFGTPVVEAARLCAVARPGQTLATSLVHTVVGSRGEAHRFVDLGLMNLKGLSAPVGVSEVDGPLESDAGATDPGTPAKEGGTESDLPASDSARRADRRRRGRVVLGVALVALSALSLVVVAAGGLPNGGDGDSVATDATVPVVEPEGYEARFRSVKCAAEVGSAVPGAECGELVVPESRAHPDRRSVAIPVVKASAKATPTADPVILLDVNEPLATTPLTGVADVYSLSLRGFGPNEETALDCNELREVWTGSLALAANDPAAIEARATASDVCSARLQSEGVQLDGYNMAEVAADVRDLLLVMDLERVTLVAGGFTTTAAVAFARANPDAVSSILLTNPVPPGRSPLEDPAAALSRVLGRVADLCAADGRCVTAFPDLVAQYEAKFVQISSSPVPVITKSLTGEGPFDVLVDGGRLAAALESALYQSARVGLVPAAVLNATPELLGAAGIDEDVKRYVSTAALAGAYLSYTCSYDAGPNRTAEITANAEAEFAGANEPTFARMCEGWGVPLVFDELSRPLDVDVPVFIAQGELSIAGSNDWAGSMAQHLERATVARFATMSEDLAFSGPQCLSDLRTAFAAHPLDRLDVVPCEGQSPEVEFAGTS